MYINLLNAHMLLVIYVKYSCFFTDLPSTYTLLPSSFSDDSEKKVPVENVNSIYTFTINDSKKEKRLYSVAWKTFNYFLIIRDVACNKQATVDGFQN